MNANNTRKQKSKISYKGSILDPGGRTGKTRQNWIKRQKSRLRSGTTTQSTGGVTRAGSNQNTQSYSRPETGNRTFKQTNAGGGSQAVRNSRELGSISHKVGVNHLGTYVGAVLDPFNAPHGARVPSEVPFPSATCSMTFTGLAAPNASGNFALMFNWQNGQTTAYSEYVVMLQDASLTAANNFVQTAIGTYRGRRSDFLPVGAAVKFRVVGAALKCWYVGKEVDRSGYFVSAFMPKAPVRDANGDIRAAYTEDALRESQYSVTCSNAATPEVIFVPRDDVDYDYMNFDGGRESSHGIIQGFGFPNTACIKWEAVVHTEFIPDPAAAGTRLLSTGISLADKGDAATLIGSLTAGNPMYVASPDNGSNLFNDFKDGVGNVLEESMYFVGDVAKRYLSSIVKDVSSDLFSGGASMMSVGW